MKKLKNSNAFKAIIFIVVMLIPLIYSFFYLKSYWNPYGNLSDMQIAVVNLAIGKDDKNQGNEFVQSLKDSDTFKICEVSKDEAQEGMKKGNYYEILEDEDKGDLIYENTQKIILYRNCHTKLPSDCLSGNSEGGYSEE